MRILKFFANILLTLICLSCCLVLTFSIILKKNLDADTIHQTVINTDMSFIIKSIDKKDNEVLDVMRDVLELIGIPDEAIDNVLNSEGTKNFLSIYISNSISYFLNQDTQIAITKDDLIKLVKDNFTVIEDSLGTKQKNFLETLEKTILDYVEKNSEKIISLFPTPKELYEQIDQESYVVHGDISLKSITDSIAFLISESFITTLLIVSIVTVILLIIINLKHKKWLKWLGSLALIYSLITFILKFMIENIFRELIMEKMEMFADIINYLISNICKQIGYGTITTFVLSVFLLILYQILRRKTGKKEEISEA